MRYQIDLAAGARDEIRALSGYIRAQALKLMKDLAREPRPPRSKELRGKENIYRIWLAGTWRIAYAIDEQNERIIVLRVRTKDRIDYDSLPGRVHEIP